MADEKPESGADQPRPEGADSAPETEAGAEAAAPPEAAAKPVADAAPGADAAPKDAAAPGAEAAPKDAAAPGAEAAPEKKAAPKAEAAPKAAATPKADTTAEAETEAEEPPAPPPPHPLVVALTEQFPGEVEAEGEDRSGNPIFRVGADSLVAVLTWLRDSDDSRFEYLADLTVTDWTERTPRFDVIYHLYSIAKNHFATVKVGCADGDGVPSVVDVWGTANWHEREAFDLYGVEFLGHPELERIFLPDDWEGFPLRKDYPLEGPNLELLTRQQAAFRGGRFDRIRGDYEMTEQERALSSSGVVGPLWTPKPPAKADESGEPGES